MHTLKTLPAIRASRSFTSNTLTPPAISTGYVLPAQIATTYNVPDITDSAHGDGVTIAILTAASNGVKLQNAAHKFWAALGLPDHSISFVQVNGAGGTGGMIETLLDMQWAGV